MSLIDQAIQFRQEGDPATEIRLRIKEFVDDIKIGGQDVLVGVFEPPSEARTAGGIILSDKTRSEYRWQGVTGLVLKLGPLAYKTEKTEDWFEEPPRIGSWVMFDVKDTHSFLLGKQPCRLVACQYIRAVISRPDLVA